MQVFRCSSFKINLTEEGAIREVSLHPSVEHLANFPTKPLDAVGFLN